MHEFGHVMGFGHTCSWPTVMYTNCERSLQIRRPTRMDALYIEYAYESHRTMLRTGAKSGLVQAYNSERRKRGLEPQWPWQTWLAMQGASASLVGSEPTLHLIHDDFGFSKKKKR